MPKSFRALFAAAPLLLFALVPTVPGPVRAAAPPSDKSLLQNPGFERTVPGHAWMPAGWDTSMADQPTVFFGRDTFLVHTGKYAVNIANTSSAIPMGNNWSQTLIVGKETWGKAATFKVWTRSNGLEGRAYLLLQAYSDTATKMARIWGVDHDEALHRLGVRKIDDPALDLAWKKVWFMDPLTEWVQREARIVVPEGTNVLYVRCGLIGTGQVMYDDASLALSPGGPPPRYAKGVNLFADSSFEGRALLWDIAIPPYEGTKVEVDSTVAHTGRMSMRLADFDDGLVETRIGVGQPFDARTLRGQRVRLSGWFKGDSLKGVAFVKVFAQGLKSRVTQSGATELLSETWDWKQLTIDFDIPMDAVEVWADLQSLAPARGTVWIDDARFEVLGPTPAPATATATQKKPAGGKR